MVVSRHAEIAGAGFAGLAAAIALRQRGWTVRVHEAAKELRAFGAGIFIWENGLRVLKAVGAYESGRCNAYTTDASGLYGIRLKLAKPDEHVVLPEIISKEPLAPFVRHGDDQWFDIVKWVHFAMVNAEELNITKANVDEQLKSENPDVRRLLGAQDAFGEQLGLTKDWGYRILKHVGNYGEVFERDVGQGSPLKIARGLNALWTKGGIMYAPPVR